MTNAEIVLGKLASCLVMVCATMAAAGLPVGPAAPRTGRGSIWRLIALCYASMPRRRSCSSAALAIWISAEAPDIRLALRGVLRFWYTGLGARPVQRVGLLSSVRHPHARVGGSHEPVARSQQPHQRGLSFWPPVWNSWVQLSYVVGRMIALQLLGVVFLTITAIARLRSGASDNRERRSACPRMAGQGPRLASFGVALRSGMIRSSGGRCTRLVRYRDYCPGTEEGGPGTALLRDADDGRAPSSSRCSWRASGRIRQPIVRSWEFFDDGPTAGANHPLGYPSSRCWNLAASVWLFTVWGFGRPFGPRGTRLGGRRL